MKKTAVILVFFALAGIATGQSGVDVRFGVGTLITDKDSFTSEDGAHYGWRAAVYGRITPSEVWYFNPGLSYERYNIPSSSEFDAFDGKNYMHFLKAYANFGFFLIQGDYFKMRLTGGAQASYLAKLDDNDSGYSTGDFNSMCFGVNGGLGFDFWRLTLDLGYEHSLSDFFDAPEQSTSQYWTLSAGIFF